ncbi:hypothetical protein OOZ63_24065 [Paucibacter sp. PLA-PC-4]|uniref:hypothetical protein n=1 Tax=Paucibacter sp. PLA-PC-4 TaxID=2993655 RepID=UPI00224ADD73|nr:hypothetical protein [Paucibacter sp. PLA-PC-4]MCX2864911.1 hypothetical protein [Paucibacter sp. PLA-PC-4]
MPSTTTSRMTLRERASTPDYPAQALQAILQIPTATDPSELLVRLVKATSAIGASASVYTATIPEGNHEPSSYLCLFACDWHYADAQEGLGQILSHPWFRFARTHTSPGTQRQVRVLAWEDEKAINLAHQYGFRSCFIVPTSAGPNPERIEMLCIGSEEADDFEGPDARIVRTLARSLAAELHDWLTCYLQQRLLEAAKLKDEDVDLLAMQWQGLNTKQIAQQTGMSVGCVNSRFQRINTRLHCADRRESAARAAAYGLLELT